MTPTLTNAQKYSPEFGFEPRTVVEVIRTSGTISVGMFDRFYDGDIKIVETEEYSGDTASRWIDVSNIKSLRLLSGKWAVWQFAPSDADIAVIWQDGDVNFFNQSTFEAFEIGLHDEYGDEFDIECPKYETFDRPWWMGEVEK